MEAFSRLIARHPCKLLLLFIFISVGLSAVVVASDWLALSDSTGFEWNVETAEESKNQDALQAAKLELDFISFDEAAAVNRTTAWSLATLYILYEIEPEAPIDTVFTPKLLQDICNFESIILDHPKYEEFCVKGCPGESCECLPQQTSVAFLFYSQEPGKYSTCDLLTAEKVTEQTTRMLNTINLSTHTPQTQALANLYSFFLSKSFGEGDHPDRSQSTRSSIRLGGPFELDRVPADATNRQIMDYVTENYFGEVSQNLQNHLGIQGALFKSPLARRAHVDIDTKQVRVSFHSQILQQNEFNSIVNTDLSAAGISILAVGLYLAIYIKSVFVAAVSILQMILSIPVSLFFYRTVLSITYFSQMHVLVIFLILGVGADDVLVCFDMWRHLDNGLSIEDRLHETLMHTRGAVFNTSFTTCVAFISTAISPLMPIAAFGAFAAIAVLMNYIFVLTITPCVIVVQHKYFSRSKNKVASGETKGDDIKPKKSKHDLDFENMPSIWAQKYYPFLNYQLGNGVKPASTIIIIVGLVFVAVMATLALKLDTPKEEEQFFSDSHMFTGFYSRMSNNFRGGEEGRYMSMNIVLGISDIERPDFVRWTPGVNRGNPVYDADFKLEKLETQNAFLEACKKLREYECGIDSCTQGPLNNGKHLLVYSPESVNCFLEDFVDYQKQLSLLRNETYVPITGDAFHVEVKNYLSMPVGGKWGSAVGFDENDKVKLVIVQARASILNAQPNGITVPYYEFIKEFFQNEVVPLDPAGFKGIFVESGRNFSWMRTQIELVNGMFSGLAICFPVAFVVLVVATGNVILSVYATFAIASIVVGVLGTSYLMGWDLGMAESIAAVIVVGFSVDYSVHIAHVYAESPRKSDRSKRVLEALAVMAPTVVAGAITTASSGMVMFVCQMLFFYKFAIIICLTIFLSVLYALGFFMALCIVAGPQNSTGELPCLKHKEH